MPALDAIKQLLSIDPGSIEPIYVQLVNQVDNFVAAGRLQPGAVMPSVREVAKSLGVDPMTVSKAYSILEGRQILLRRRGRPMTVGPHANEKSPAERLATIRPKLDAIVREAKQLAVDDKALETLFQELLGSRQ